MSTVFQEDFLIRKEALAEKGVSMALVGSPTKQKGMV